MLLLDITMTCFYVKKSMPKRFLSRPRFLTTNRLAPQLTPQLGSMALSIWLLIRPFVIVLHVLFSIMTVKRILSYVWGTLDHSLHLYASPLLPISMLIGTVSCLLTSPHPTTMYLLEKTFSLGHLRYKVQYLGLVSKLIIWVLWMLLSRSFGFESSFWVTLPSVVHYSYSGLMWQCQRCSLVYQHRNTSISRSTFTMYETKFQW